MKKQIQKITIAVGIFFAFIVPISASAHVLKTDGDIGAVLHVNPNDDPIAGEPATFLFEFKDKSGKFKPDVCECFAKITEHGKEIYSVKLFEQNTRADLNTPLFSYTFPSRNIYAIEMSGKSTDGSFQSFSLKYDVRVDKGAGMPLSPAGGDSGSFWDDNFDFVVFGGAFFAMFILYLRERRKKREKVKHVSPVASAFSLLAAVVLVGFSLHATQLDGALSFHHNPVFHGHECCQAQVATFTPSVELSAKFAEAELDLVQEHFFQKEFNLSVSNKSPPKEM